ncbi:hypothetical protein DPMN_050952 [Dreissena polymorpha]|uniref:Uncharacterized protein n=1 Tax=Dreissena polymorpha TaxID=45954 RepID=A0A9D4CJ32_DREPO|nr:hypothetical protein DPMN_050952 [Dreissena polymorpha]
MKWKENVVLDIKYEEQSVYRVRSSSSSPFPTPSWQESLPPNRTVGKLHQPGLLSEWQF